MIKVSFLNGPRADESLVFADGVWSLGRAPDNAVVIPDASVSARHAELRVEGGQVVVRELGARNGVYVQGRRVAGDAQVESEATVRLGAVELRLVVESVGETADATDVTASYALRRPLLPVAPARPGPVVVDRLEERGNAALNGLPSPTASSLPKTSAAPVPRRQTGWVVALAMALAAAILWVVFR